MKAVEKTDSSCAMSEN